MAEIVKETAPPSGYKKEIRKQKKSSKMVDIEKRYIRGALGIRKRPGKGNLFAKCIGSQLKLKGKPGNSKETRLNFLAAAKHCGAPTARTEVGGNAMKSPYVVAREKRKITDKSKW